MTEILADPVEEARRILDAASAGRVELRAIGGIGVALRAPSIHRLQPSRRYHDLDLVGRAPRAPIETLLSSLGYEPSRRFNTLNGAERLLFHDPDGRRVDVFLDTLRMCHTLPFARRLTIDADTLPLADLALTKLQIVELTERDAQDLAALLADHPLTDDEAGIAVPRVAAITSADWGWWRTVTGNLTALVERWQSGRDTGHGDDHSTVLGTAAARATELSRRLHAVPKSLRWRARAGIGDRLIWYDEPEEVR
jgi:hypothetical protein